MAEEVVNRRLAAIVAADAVGYSRLMGADEAGTRVRFNAHLDELIKPAIAVRQGRIVKTTGDGLLIEFASVVDAVQSAIEIQKGMAERNADEADDKRIEFRIGVNLGDVIVEGDDIHGDGVNVAARLEALADPGGISLSRAARDQVRDRVDVELEDLGEVEVKNVRRRVRVFKVLLDGSERQVGSTGKAGRRRLTVWTVAGVGGLVALVALVFGWPYVDSGKGVTGDDERPSRSGPAAQELRPALVILPFANMSSDGDQEYFSDGFTEDLTTALARIPGLLVTARNTAFTYKGKSVTAVEVGKQLGVRYMLEGSVRRQGDRLRLNAQLIDTGSGNHVWAEAFDRPLTDIFVVQDKLVNRIVGSVASRLRRREGERTLKASPETLTAYDLTSRARLLFRRNDIRSIREARKLLLRAVKIDPEFSLAFATLAQVENFFFTHRTSEEYATPKAGKRVVAAAAKAVTLDPENASARAIHGMSLRLLGNYEEAAKEAVRARELAPNDPDVLASISVILVGVGDYEGVVQAVNRARILDPYINPLHVGVIQAQALFALGDYRGSKAAALFCLKRSPKDVRCHESLVRALGELGSEQEARAAVSKLMQLSPNYTVSEYIRRARKNRRDQAAVGRWADGLRKAGVPERSPIRIADKPSIAVLPFVNMSDVEAQDYFSDGITEDIITDLSKISGLAVIARNSSFLYKGRSVDVREISRDLNVRHVLEGSVRRAGEMLRITAQLVDAETGENVWAERFDRKAEDVFAIQDEIVSKIVAELSVTLMANEQERLFRTHATNIQAYETFLKARKTHLVTTPANIARAMALYRQVIELDPAFAGGYAGLSFLVSLNLRFGRSDDREAETRYAVELAEKSVSIDPEFGWAYIALGSAQVAMGKASKAVSTMHRAVELQPSDADALLFLGFYQVFAGSPFSAIDNIKLSIQLDPKPTNRQFFFLGWAYFMSLQFDNSIIALEKWDSLSPRRSGLIPLAAAYALSGDPEMARATTKRYLAEIPKFHASSWAFMRNFEKADDRSLILKGMRAAGLPE